MRQGSDAQEQQQAQRDNALAASLELFDQAVQQSAQLQAALQIVLAAHSTSSSSRSQQQDAAGAAEAAGSSSSQQDAASAEGAAASSRSGQQDATGAEEAASSSRSGQQIAAGAGEPAGSSGSNQIDVASADEASGGSSSDQQYAEQAPGSSGRDLQQGATGTHAAVGNGCQAAADTTAGPVNGVDVQEQAASAADGRLPVAAASTSDAADVAAVGDGAAADVPAVGDGEGSGTVAAADSAASTSSMGSSSGSNGPSIRQHQSIQALFDQLQAAELEYVHHAESFKGECREVQQLLATLSSHLHSLTAKAQWTRKLAGGHQWGYVFILRLVCRTDASLPGCNTTCRRACPGLGIQQLLYACKPHAPEHRGHNKQALGNV